MFVTGHGKDGPVDLDWATLIRPNQTVAIYMGLGHIEELARAFVANGADPDLPAAVVDNGARANQRVVVGTLATIAAQARAAALRGPTIIIVGTVVALRDKLKWYEGVPSPVRRRVSKGIATAHPVSRKRPQSQFCANPRQSVDALTEG